MDLKTLAITLALTDPAGLTRLEREGFGFEAKLGAMAGATRELLRDEIEGELASVQGAAKFPVKRLGSFELAGIVQRPDRAWHAATPCGETRLIYRPVHGAERLPATVSLVLSACEDAKTAPVLRVETNVLTARWLSREDQGFSDQAHYMMRVFVPRGAEDGQRTEVVLAPLENTPDAPALAGNAAKRRALIRWLATPERVKAANAGTIDVPKRFLATRVASVSPYGPARAPNRPFSASLAVGELQDALDKAKVGVDAATLLHRLDTLSCTGCHQTRSLAGFHFLGYDRKPESPSFTLVKPFSALFEALQPTRQKKGTPALPVADCGAAPAYADLAWSAAHGQCLPRDHTKPSEACDVTRVSASLSPLNDRLTEPGLLACAGAGVCAPARAGFPAGQCGEACAALAAGTASSDTKLCTGVPLLGPFTKCLEAGESHRACAARHHTRIHMVRCSSHGDCRPDYACVNDSEYRGYCAPTYFAPELALPR